MRNLLNLSFLNRIFDIKLLSFLLICFLALSVLTQSKSWAQFGVVIDTQKISNAEDFPGDPFVGQLAVGDLFGSSVSAGAIDGDGNTDFFVGAFGTKDGAGDATGAAWILFLNGQGQVTAFQKISNDSDFAGDPFVGELADDDEFGHGGTIVGDVNGDGFLDAAVGSPGAGDNDEGAVWILFLDGAGQVTAFQKISNAVDNTGDVFVGQLDQFDEFGHTVGAIGDLDGDGIPDIIAASPGDDNDTGSAWVLFLNANGTVKTSQKITSVDLGNGLQPDDRFGGAGANSIGNLNDDNVTDTAIGAPAIFSNPPRFGSVWVVFLDTDGTVKGFQEISDNLGGFPAGVLDVPGQPLGDRAAFGHGVSAKIRVESKSTPFADIAAGDFFDNEGAVYISRYKKDGKVKSGTTIKISNNMTGFPDELDDNDWFGFNTAAIGDLNEDGTPDITASALRDDGNDTGTVNDDFGAVWILFLTSIDLD